MQSRWIGRPPASLIAVKRSLAHRSPASTRLMAKQPAASFCCPSDEAFCPGCSWLDGTCFDGECEALHVSPQHRRRQLQLSQPQQQLLVIAAGPERSGSTWLFNAIRLLLDAAQEPCDPFWVSHLTQAKLDDRLRGGRHVLIKTHGWSDQWQVPTTCSCLITLTHRDLRGVLASYQRMGWAYRINSTYVEEHQRWKDICDLDVAFENIVSQPHTELERLAKLLDLGHKVDLDAVLADLQSLKAPDRGPPDPVSKLWPRHISSVPGAAFDKEGLTSAQLQKQFPEYFSHYGYS